MIDLYSPRSIRAIADRFGFRNRKSLGQNFLTDRNVVLDMISAAGIGPEDTVIEIGPGIGALTRELSLAAGRVIALEIDRDLFPVLEFTLSGCENVEVIHADVLKTDIGEMIREAGGAKVIGNLPYYITTPIIMRLLESRPLADSITIMMQKEVAERILAEAGDPGRGALSIAVQYRCEAEEVVDVPKESFSPVPKVDSAVLKLTPRAICPVAVDDEELFFRCVRAGFGQRRKTLYNSLTGTGIPKERIGAALDSVGIERNRRAEALTMQEFADIANELGRNGRDAE